jgi:hypothetical protein
VRDRLIRVVDALERPLTVRFARRAGIVSTGVCLAVLVGWLFTYRDGLDWQRAPVGTDFVAFWWAARVTWQESAVRAYDLAYAWQGQHDYWPGLDGVFAWVYPPSFLLVVLGLGLLPYLVAFGVWTVATAAPFVGILRTQLPRGAGWLLAGFPGLWVGIGQGQNQFLTATLMAGAIVLVRRRPVAAGLCAGLLAIKPHLAVLLPVAFLAARAWRAFAVAAVTAVGVTLGSIAVLGWGTLTAWFDAMGFVSSAILSGRLPVWKFVSPYTALLWLGLPWSVAMVLHVLVAAMAVLLVWRVWRRTDDTRLRGIALMSATFLVTPYSADYDLAWLAFPMAWLAGCAIAHGWRRGDRLLLAVAYVGVLTTLLGAVTHVQVAPFLLGGLLLTAYERSSKPGA